MTNNVVEDKIRNVVDIMRQRKAGNIYQNLNALLPVDAPFFLFGNIEELNDRLLKKSNDPVERRKKFPLVAMRLVQREKVGDGMIDYDDINIAIVAASSQAKNSEQRLADTFKPILFPLYDLFFESLRVSGHFVWQGTLPSHVKINQYYWGTTSGNKPKNIFSDPCDAIEILNLKIKSTIKNC